MKSITLLHKLLFLCGVAIVAAATLGLWAERSLGAVSDAASRISEMCVAQRAQMDADMMHDGIRADVLQLNLAVVKDDAELRKGALDGLREHIARFRESMKTVGADPDPVIQRAVHDVNPGVERYLHAAESMLDARAGDCRRWMAFSRSSRRSKSAWVSSPIRSRA